MSFIKNYGLFWRRDRVEWGKPGPGNAGSVAGYAAKSNVRVDFRDQAGVYVLYDGADIPSLTVTYVGRVGRRSGDSLFGRLRDHCNDHLWNRWTRFSWFGVFRVGKAGRLTHAKVSKVIRPTISQVIDHLEGALTTVLEPPLNKRGANWGGATQYFQDEPEVDEVVARLIDIEARLAHLEVID